MLRIQSGLFANAVPVRAQVRRAAREEGTKTVVRDVLCTAGGDMAQERVYPTVHAAVEASLTKR